MRLSFVIPAHNEEQHIRGTIAAIRESMAGSNEAYEIVVAADGCTDGTVPIAEAAGARVVSHERRQIAATRNLGARAATGDVFVFVDADTRVTREVTTQLQELISAGAVAGGATIAFDGPLPLYARVLIPLITCTMRCANLTGGAFLFCTREAFEKAGGWDEQFFAGEEIHFARALKRVGRFRLVRSPVLTSGRKMRTYSGLDFLRLFIRGLLTPSIVKDRSKLDLFYGPRRKDPMAGG